MQWAIITTHFLKYHEQASSAHLKSSGSLHNSQTGESMIANFSKLENQQDMITTHSLEGQEQESLGWLKHCETWQPLTGWSTKNGDYHYAQNEVNQRVHSQTTDARPDIVSRFERQQAMAATCFLECQGEAL